MKTLKELNEKCVLIAEFKNPAFICVTAKLAFNFASRPNKAAIYYSNNKGKYYLYKYIKKAIITEYDNLKNAVEDFTHFIKIVTVL